MGIFDQSFITPEPKTDIKNQLIALAMRNEAMNPEKVLTGLGEIGKVFTDAEEEQQKANTAILQRRLDMLTPAQIEAMVAQGIDPVTEAYKRNIPINVDDAAINKAWRDNIVDAQKEQGNKWVTTVLPSIPHEDKLKLLEGDTAIYTKWGLTDFMRMDPNLRTFIYDNIKSAADRENELLYYRTKLPVKGYLEKGEFPSSIFANNPDANPNGALPIAQMTQDDTAVQTAANTTNQTDASLGLPDSNTLGTGDNRVTRLNAHAKALADLFLVEQNTGNPNLTIDEFLQQQEPSFKEDYGISDPAEIAKLKQLVKDSLSNPDNANQWRERVNLSTPPRDESVLDTVASQEEAINEIDAFKKIKNTKAATAKEDNLKKNINNFITEDFFSELYEAAESGATKEQLSSMLRNSLNDLSSLKSKLSPTLYKYHEEALKSLYQPFINQAADTAEQREKNMQESRSQAKQQLMSDGNSIVGKGLRASNGNLSDLPPNFKKLNNDTLDTIKGAFLKNSKLDAYWAGADDFTKKLIIWETLNKVGLLNSFNDNASDIKEFIKSIENSPFYKTGINDESFIQRIERIAHMDINNSRKSQKLEKEMNASLASDSTKQMED